jgi:hypothetical protein
MVLRTIFDHLFRRKNRYSSKGKIDVFDMTPHTLWGR